MMLRLEDAHFRESAFLQRGRPAPRRGRGPWNRTPPPPRHAGQPCPHPDHAITKTDSRNDTEHKGSNIPEQSKHLKYAVLVTGVDIRQP